MASLGSFSKLVSATGGGYTTTTTTNPVAGQTGCVRPSRIVTLNSDGCVAECTTATDPWGISQPSPHNFPLAGWDDGFAGIGAGITVNGLLYQYGSPPINVFGPGDDECLVQLGGTVTVGARLKSDAQGRAIAVTTSGDSSIAIAHRVGGVTDDVILVKPQRFDVGANAPV